MSISYAYLFVCLISVCVLPYYTAILTFTTAAQLNERRLEVLYLDTRYAPTDSILYTLCVIIIIMHIMFALYLIKALSTAWTY